MQSKNYPNIGETLYCATLSNGLKLNVVPKPGLFHLLCRLCRQLRRRPPALHCGRAAGGYPRGRGHFLEHKMFDLPGGDNALNILSANGADPNAFTSSGVTCYYFQCTEHFEENLRMLLHFVSTPYFTPETVQKEQGIIAQEIRMGEDSPGSAIYYNLLELLYEHHPIRDKVAGTVESIAEISDKTLYDCHKVFYAPSNMTLCVEGDVDAEKIRAIAEELLPKDRSPVPSADFGPEEGPLPVSPLRREAMSVSAPQFLIGAKLWSRPGGRGGAEAAPCFPACPAPAGGSFLSLLYRALRKGPSKPGF